MPNMTVFNLKGKQVYKGPMRKAPAKYKSKRISKPAAKVVRAIAKSVVSKQAEDKFISSQGSVLFNSRISTSSECYPLVPQITQGTGDYQRIGDRITGKYMYVKGYVQIDQTYLNNTIGTGYLPACTVRAMILSQKNIKVGVDVGTRADVAHLLKDNIGTGAARYYDGDLLDNLAPINKDLFKVYMDKKMKFSWVARGDSSVSGDTGFGVGQERTKYFTVRIKLPKTMTFDDGNLDWVNNFAPFLCVGAVNDDGTAKYTVGTPFRVGWLSTVYFEDS